MAYTAEEIISHLRYYWQKAEGLDYGQEHEVMRAAATEIERLRLWIRRIDNINDEPSRFSTEIDRACIDALAGKPVTGMVTLHEQTGD